MRDLAQQVFVYTNNNPQQISEEISRAIVREIEVDQVKKLQAEQVKQSAKLLQSARISYGMRYAAAIDELFGPGSTVVNNYLTGVSNTDLISQITDIFERHGVTTTLLFNARLQDTQATLVDKQLQHLESLYANQRKSYMQAALRLKLVQDLFTLNNVRLAQIKQQEAQSQKQQQQEAAIEKLQTLAIQREIVRSLKTITPDEVLANMLNAEAEILTSKDIFAAVLNPATTDKQLVAMITPILTRNGIGLTLSIGGYNESLEQRATELAQIVRATYKNTGSLVHLRIGIILQNI